MTGKWQPVPAEVGFHALELIKQSHRESLNRQSTRVGITLCCVLPIVIAVIIAVVIVASVLASLDSEPARTTPAPTSTVRSLVSTSTPRVSTQVPIPGFGDGVWRVGRDIEPGTYRSPGLDLCYWERLSGFSGTSDDLITNGIGDFEMIVTIKETDRGFLSDGCHWWTLIDP